MGNFITCFKGTNALSKLPHNCETILKDADPPISIFSDNHNLFEQLRSGVFLNPTKLVKYWVDKRNINCFMIFPRKLSITWSNDPKYWTWIPNKESPNETIIVEVAEMKNVCWLDITGKFDTTNLTPKIEYEVVFKVMLKDPYGWDTPVNLKLVMPNDKDKPQEQTVDLRELPTSQWFDVKVGEFIIPEKCVGEMTFSMYEHNENGEWKKGLFLKGVEIRPKKTY